MLDHTIGFAIRPHTSERVLLGVLLASTLAISCAHSPVISNGDTASQIDQIGQGYNKLTLSIFPMNSRALASVIRQGALPDLSITGHQRSKKRLKTLRRQLRKIAVDGLSVRWLRIRSILDYRIKSQLDRQVCQSHYWAINPVTGLHLIPGQLAALRHPDRPYAIGQLIAAYKTFPPLMEHHMANLMSGQKRALSAPRIMVLSVIQQLDDTLSVPIEKSTFMAKNITKPPQSTHLSQSLKTSVSTDVYTALHRFRTFLKRHILPNARRTVGLVHMPDGHRCYKHLIDTMGTGYPSAKSIHRMGLSDTHRALQEIELLRHRLGLRSSTSIPSIYGIQWKARSQSTGVQPPGTTAEFHDGLSYILPSYLRQEHTPAFLLGWQLYQHELSSKNDSDNVDYLMDSARHRLHQALDLVVDTGIHALGWSRSRAIQFVMVNGGTPEVEAAQKVDLCIAKPAQQLAPALGKKSLIRLQVHAQAVLGDGFNLRAFRRQLIKYGAVPLPILEDQIRWWLGREEIFIAQ